MGGADRENLGRKWSAPDFVLAAWVFYLGSTVFKLGSKVFIFQIVPWLYQNYTKIVPKLYHRFRPSMWSSVWFFGDSANFLVIFI